MDYEKQADDFLRDCGVTFEAVCIGSDCPKYCPQAGTGVAGMFPRRDHIHGKHYFCTLKRKEDGRTVSFDFWNSYADEEFNYWRKYGPKHRDPKGRSEWLKMRKRPEKTVSAYDLLACLQKYEVGSFSEFCDKFGYSADSIKAHETWEEVGEEYAKVSSFFMGGELEELQEIN